MKGVPIVVTARSVREQLPEPDTDVLIWDVTSLEAQLGAYVAEEDGHPVWVDAQGARVPGVTHWADMPLLHAFQKAGAAPCTESQTHPNR